MNDLAENVRATTKDRVFARIQTWLPTRFLSWCMFLLTRIETRWFKNAFIRIFMKRFHISLEEAEFQRPEAYRSFNHFFTRALKEDARPVAFDPDAFISPVDGTVSQLGQVEQ